MKKQPNPQGKGVNPILDTLMPYQNTSVPAKDIQEISHELFTALFILESQFNFKPVVNKTYYLYKKQEKFHLSLIAPSQWNENIAGQYIGQCVLHNDLIWSLKLDEKAEQDPIVMQYITAKRKAFDQALEQVETIEQSLPIFNPFLSFYQRALAFGLSHSLQISMQKEGIYGLSYQQAKKRLGK